MLLANRPLNYQAKAIEEAETKIRILVKEEYIKGVDKRVVDKKVRDIINQALKQIKIKQLQIATIKSLLLFYTRQYNTIKTLFDGDFKVLALVISLTRLNITKMERRRVFLELRGKGYFNATDNLYGVPNQNEMYQYLAKETRPIIEKLENQMALDPDAEGYWGNRASMLSRAEKEVRYQAHQDNIAKLKLDGHKLCIASTHADCSERCSKLQGKVYSLDGSYGKTDDGRDFQPLENATDIYETTKSGVRYKNGLLGFNCRHYLIPYQKGFRFPTPNIKEERKQTEITQKQRYLERMIRKWEIIEKENKYFNKNRYKEAKLKKKKWYEAYKKYSISNGRAYYPSRTKII